MGNVIGRINKIFRFIGTVTKDCETLKNAFTFVFTAYSISYEGM